MIEDHFNVTDSMDKIFLSKLSININDPRQNNEFLWLSYNINNIKAGQHERTYWMTLEKDAYHFSKIMGMIFRLVHGTV